jgi:hypothetical protein
MIARIREQIAKVKPETKLPPPPLGVIKEASATDEELKELVASRVVDVVEAVEALRGSGAADTFDDTLNALLEQYYAAADSLLGGGGSTPLSSSSSGSGGPDVAE